ncbi:unnamed protein product [Adineta ricciae]|uniref:Uncharacterized protein n=1 Tax=Adineta ricciae TaxID=249248 RepID=A0A814NWS4_ADIRI|nr:unnamed protein product [Adineta ricciae]CAF1498516.1 unnamed protein product [Adineta ricciae]
MSKMMSSIGKINRIEKVPLPPDQAKAARSTKIPLITTRLPQIDYLNIFKGLTVLFIGDNTIRTIYKDFCSVLKYDRLLDYTEAARQHGQYKPVQDERVLLSDGKIGTDQYRDIKEFFLKDNSTRLIFVYIATIFDGIAQCNLEYLKTTDQSLSIDVIVFSSYVNDMNKKKIDLSKQNIGSYFDKYLSHLGDFSTYLSKFCSVPNKTQHYFWMTPLPQPFHMSPIKESQFEQHIKDAFHTVKVDTFIQFDRYDIWKRRKDLTIAENGYFSLHGIREVSDSFTRFLAVKLNRYFTSSIALPITPLSYLNDKSVVHNDCSKQTTTISLSKSNRYHPYNH